VSTKDRAEIPDQVHEVLKNTRIGYLSVKSEKGDLYTYPVAFYSSKMNVYFMTPISAAKMRFMRANPDVSFLADNHDLTLGATGAMIQGRAKIFSIAKTVTSILSVGPKMQKFAQKYPGMFTFYAKGKELPDERKLYKYRLIRIEPTKVIYWVGYKFGRYVPKPVKKDPLAGAPEDEKMETLALLLKGADEELSAGEEPPANENWQSKVNAAASQGVLSEEERVVIGSYRSFLRQATASNTVGPKVTDDEKRFLKKWKSNSGK
jgi:general stress protein 26